MQILFAVLILYLRSTTRVFGLILHAERCGLILTAFLSEIFFLVRQFFFSESPRQVVSGLKKWIDRRGM